MLAVCCTSDKEGHTFRWIVTEQQIWWEVCIPTVHSQTVCRGDKCERLPSTLTTLEPGILLLPAQYAAPQTAAGYWCYQRWNMSSRNIKKKLSNKRGHTNLQSSFGLYLWLNSSVSSYLLKHSLRFVATNWCEMVSPGISVFFFLFYNAKE